MKKGPQPVGTRSLEQGTDMHSGFAYFFFLKTHSVFYLHFKTNFHLKITYPTPISFLLSSLKTSKHVLLNKDCKQLIMSVTCNKREQLLTEIQNPKHLFIINTGIKTILHLCLTLTVVSTHTASRTNTVGYYSL